MRILDIHEAAMNRGSYEKALRSLGDDLKIGFEAEFVVPENSDLYEVGNKIEGKTSSIDHDIKDMDDVEKYMDVSTGEYSRMRHEMEIWNEEELEYYVEEQWERFDSNESRGRREATENWKDNHPDEFMNWINGKYHSVSDMLNTHRISPRWPVPGDSDSFYTSEPPDDNEGTKQATFKNVAWALAKVVDDDVEVSFEKEPNKHNMWYVEPDTSIDHDDGDFVGAEIVSPPMPASQALVAMEEVFDFASKHRLQTNTSTGLHINFSVPNMASQFDALKFILFFDERYALKLFGRELNMNARPQLLKIANALTMTGLPDLEDLESKASTLLSRDKYVAVNIGKLKKHGYVELRALGGEGYEHDMKIIKEMVGRLAVALQAAIDPGAERPEYARKLAKLADTVGKLRTPASKIETPYRGLDPLLNTDPDLQLHYEGLVNYKDMDALQRFLEAMQRQLKRLGRRLSEKERVHMRLLLRKTNISKVSAYDGQTFVVKDLLKDLGI